MRITSRQKNIPNPFYNEYEYDWQNSRNRIVLAAIHEYITQLYLSPSVGQILFASSIGIPDGDRLRQEDLEAYLALYPQNGVLQENKIDFISDTISLEKLQHIADKIKELDPEGTTITQNFTSDTTPESIIPPAHNPVPGARNLSTSTIMARLVRFPDVSLNYRKSLRAIVGREGESLSPNTADRGTRAGGGIQLPYIPSSIGSSGNLVNFYDWRKNILPGSVEETTYYNPTDNSYYYLKRTNNVVKTDYDVSLPNDRAVENKIQAMRSGAINILKLLGVYSNDTVSEVLGQPENIKYETYISERPADRWTYAIIIEKSSIENIIQGRVGTSFEDDIFVTDFIDTLKEAEKVSVHSSVTFSDKDFENLLASTVSLLRYYQSTLNTEMITPEMLGGFDIAAEIAKIEIFKTSLSSLLEIHGVTWTGDSYGSVTPPATTINTKVEIKLDKNKNILFVVANGTYIYTPLGITPFTPNNELSQNISGNATSLRVPNVFSSCTPRTYGILENLDTLSKEMNKDVNQRLPWSEFVKTMIFPKVKISPKNEQEEIRKKINFGFQPPKAFGTNIFQRAEEVVSLDSINMNRRFFDSRYAFQNIRSQLQKATDGCDSGLSKLTKAVDQFWPLIQKEDWMAAGITAATYIKEELITEKAQKEMITNAERYINPNNPLNPAGSAAAADAARWLEEEISCLLDNLGKLTAETLLPPGADPGDGKKLIQTVSSEFPLKFDFSTSENLAKSAFFIPVNFQDPRIWKPFRKQIMKQLERLMMQLILAIIQDLLKALLGCGYDESSSQSNDPDLYGFANINGSFYELKDPDDLKKGYNVLINIVPVAKKIGFVNRQLDDSYNVIESDVTHEQLIALNNDISRVTTPAEIKLLLDGDAPEHLLFGLVEMINKGQVDLTGIPRRLHNDPVVASIRQESYTPDDERYAMLGIDKDNLKEYLVQIGDLLPQASKEEIGDAPIGTPDDLFCEPARIPRQDVSEEQALLNLDAAIVAKQKELENLCEMFNFNNPLQGLMDGVWDFLEVPDWYKAALDAIADFIKYWTSWLESEQGDLADGVGASAGLPYFENTSAGKQILLDNPRLFSTAYFPQYEIIQENGTNYTYCTSPQQSQLLSGEARFANLFGSPNAVNISSVSSPTNEYSPPAWTDQEASLFNITKETTISHQVIFRVDGNQVKFYLRNRITGEKDLLASHSLARSNAIYLDRPLDQNPAESPYSAGTNGLSIRNTRTPTGTFPSPFGLAMTAPEGTLDDNDTIEKINGLLQRGGNSQGTPLQGMNFVSSNRYTAWTYTEWFYYSTNLRWRLKPFGAALGKEYLIPDDKCKSPDELAMASLICNCIWTRIKKFMWNVAPLMNVYPQLNIPDCMEPLGDYLYRKYERELEKRGILGLMLENLWTVEKNYRTIPDNDIVPWRNGGEDQSISVGQFLENYSTPRNKLKALFTLSLIGVFKRLSLEDSFDGSGSRNPLLPPYTKYEKMEPAIYNMLASAYGDSFQYSENSVEWRSRVQYFAPVPLMLAQHYMAFDSIANPIGSVKSKEQRYDIAIAMADDDILNTLRGFGAGIYRQQLYQGFPVEVGVKTYYNKNDVSLDIQRITGLMTIIDRLTIFEGRWMSKMNAAEQLRREAEALTLGDLDNLREVEYYYKSAGRMLSPANLPLGVFIPAYPPALHGFVSWHERTDDDGTPVDIRNIKDRTGDHTWWSKYEEGRESGPPMPVPPILAFPPVTSTNALWWTLSVARDDVGLWDDPWLVRFWQIVNEINSKIDQATTIYKGLAQEYYNFQQEYISLYQGLQELLSASGDGTYANVIDWMSSTFTMSGFTAITEAYDLKTGAWSEDMPFWAPGSEEDYALTTGRWRFDQYDRATNRLAISKQTIKLHLETLRSI